MKLTSTLAVLGAFCTLVSAAPQTGGWHPCPTVCRPVAPVCPPDEAPTGGEGCWGCCQPVKTLTSSVTTPKPTIIYPPPTFTVPTTTKPTTTKPTTTPTLIPCPAVCRDQPPVCEPGWHAGGGPGCWSCCVPDVWDPSTTVKA